MKSKPGDQRIIKFRLKTSLIAPCGMNCGLCLAYQRTKNKCAGCNSGDLHKPNYCIRCSIRNCEKLLSGDLKYCFSCSDFPCKRLKQLDKRYRTKYHMSMIENLLNIKQQGIRKFIRLEQQKWTCTNCHNIICVHRNECPVCGNATH